MLFVLIFPTISIQKKNLDKEGMVKIENLGPNLRIFNHRTAQVMVMPLEKYVFGVVAAEMPASFHLEALKAQAVIARTYALKKINNYSQMSSSAHPDADICTDPKHCQDWKSDVELREKWGFKYFNYYHKVQSAVKATQGEVVTYQGKLIEPVYHSTCGGRTENSEDVWMVKLPYLRSVECHWCKNSPRYEQRLLLSWDEIEKRLDFPVVTLVSGVKTIDPQDIIQPLKKTATGRIKQLQIGEQVISGTEFRNRLELNSIWVSLEADQEKVIFYMRGFGHGVGLCQYGANGLAREGKNYKEIIKYYYQDVEIVRPAQ